MTISRLDKLQGLYDDFQALADEAAARALEIRRDDGLTRQGKDERLAELREDIDGRREQLVDRRNRLTDLLTLFVDRYADSRPPTTTDKILLADRRRERAWQRAERLLDAGHAPGGLIDDADDQGDVTTLEALREELPSYVHATGPPPSMAENRNGHLQAEQAADELVDRIDAALARNVDGRRSQALQIRLTMPAVLDAVDRAHHLVSAWTSNGRKISRLGPALAARQADDQRKAVSP